MKKLNVAIIGAGNRGNIYGDFAIYNPDKMKVVAVAELDNNRRELFAKKHQLSYQDCFHSWEEIFGRPKFCDAVIITTQDRMHYKPTMLALELGYHVLVEKPLSPNLEECIEMISKAKEKNRLLMLGYVLRYTPFFQKMKELVMDGVIGNIRHIAIDMNVAYWHQAHSFVRGNWNNQSRSSPMILAKSCHDFDILCYLLEKECIRVSSFGSLSHFKKENAPNGSTERCTDGCLVERECPFSALKIYLGENIEWPVSTISTDLSKAMRYKAIKEGPYGRCVYQCNNDVVDHQIVNLLFTDGITASLTMSGFTRNLKREIKIFGTMGEINGTVEEGKIKVLPFGKNSETIQVKASSFGQHSGGDRGLMEAFLHDTSLKISEYLDVDDRFLNSHMLAHAAEESRLTNQVIHLEEYFSKAREIYNVMN
jgi:predicted dehydrogenase